MYFPALGYNSNENFVMDMAKSENASGGWFGEHATGWIRVRNRNSNPIKGIFDFDVPFLSFWVPIGIGEIFVPILYPRQDGLPEGSKRRELHLARHREHTVQCHSF